MRRFRIFWILTVLFACGSDHTDRERLLAQIKSGPFIDTTARDLANAYAANDTGGDPQFRGRVLRVAGHFGRARRENGRVVVFIWGDHHHFDSDRPGERSEVACDYVGDESVVSAFAADFYITAHALGAGAAQGMPLLVDCVIEPR